MNSSEVAPIRLSEVAVSAATARPAVTADISVVGHVQVQLDAVVGACQISVERLMQLSSGDVLTLLADLDDPIVLRLNDKPIARGELVAVGDHFGVRVVEVL